MNSQKSQIESAFHIAALSDREFERICDAVYGACRLNLHNGKKELVQSRLNKRLRKLGFNTYRQYLNYINDDTSCLEFQTMVDTLTTNVTHFFREPDHFDYLRDNVLSNIDTKTRTRCRIWSAGCSTGEEAYSLAIVLRETLPKLDLMDVKVLATDISTKVLTTARAGRYAESRFKNMPRNLMTKYFALDAEHGGEVVYEAKPELKRLLTFYHLNLINPWPMRGPFDVIFCRNVMIYFDKQTQAELIARFYDMLSPGGSFIVGHSESLTGLQRRFKYIQPSVYVK
ncbi:MAG: protein-glutamate O-methyltransferase CheR [bacterium]